MGYGLILVLQLVKLIKLVSNLEISYSQNGKNRQGY